MGELASLEDSGEVVGVSAPPGKVLVQFDADDIDGEHVYWLSPRRVDFHAAIERVPRQCHRALAHPGRIPLEVKSLE